jgi:exosortase A
MSEAIADEPLARVLSGLRDARAGLAIGLAIMGILFHTEIAVAIKTWIDSTAYNHCFLVIPIAVFLIWDRRSALRGLTVEPMPLAALPVLPLGVIWLASERLGIMEGRQLAALSMVEVLFFAMLGPRLWRAVSGPLLYLYFLVPFGEFLTPKLQDITTWFVRHGVDMLGITAYIDGYVIQIPEGTFFVAEACAGLRFLIAAIAFGALYGLLMYRSPMRRTIFMAASIIVPIIANGFRALGIVWLGHVLGSAEAGAADHVLYGWIFFSIVILLLIVVGLPFREDIEPEEATTSPMTPSQRAARHGLFAGLAVAALAAAGPLIVLRLDQASAAPAVASRPLDLSPVCVSQGAQAVPAGKPGRATIQVMNCGGTIVTVETEVFDARSTAGPVNAERRHLTRIGGAEDWTEAPLVTQSGDRLSPWRLVRGTDPDHIAAAALWIDGKPALPGMAMRLGMARSSVFGGASAPVLVVLTPTADWAHIDMRRKQALEDQIATLVQARADLGEQIKALAQGGH